jgi:hypothetical protein
MSQRDIVVAGSPSIKDKKTYSLPQVKARPGTGRPSVREMAAATIQQKVADGERKQRLKWKTQLEAMAKGPQDPMTRIYIAEEYLSKLPKDSRNSLEAEVLAYVLDASFQAINNHEKHKDETNSITLTYMWGVLTRLMKLKHGVSVDISEYVRQICQCLGLPAVSLSVHTKQALSFKPLTIPQKPKNLVGMSGVDFQLMHGGPFMERGIGSLPDPRTPDFEPDLWQREVLDQIDAKMSAFIVAPTSAGKTFIS